MTKRALVSIAALAAGLALTSVGAAAQPARIASTGQSESKPAPRNAADSITVGQRVDGRLSRSREIYTMEGRAGQRVRISLSSSRFDPVLALTGPGGFALENDDAPNTQTRNSMIETVLPANGTYRLTVSAYGSSGRGEFRLAVLDTANPAGGNARAVAFGETATGMLTASDDRSYSDAYVDYFSYAGKAGERVTFDLGSPEIDTVLSVYLPTGVEERNDDFRASDGTDSRLSITLPEDGTYTIAASSFSPGEQGRYTLTVSAAADGVRTVRPASGDARVFALTVGVADYRRISPLDRTDDDARQVSEALERAGMLAPESITLLNAQATRANFRSALSDLTQAMSDDDLLLIFFSGHGEKVENMTTERDGSAETIELYDAALFDYELAGMLEDFDSRLLLVLDACFAGGFDNVVRQRDDRMGIFSSDEDVLSLVADGQKAGGYISHIFRAAMSGAADMNRDNAIEAGELSEYMRREFYRIALEQPLATDAEDFRDMQTPGWQHIVVDRGGDGMPHQQVLMNLGSAHTGRLARAN